MGTTAWCACHATTTKQTRSTTTNTHLHEGVDLPVRLNPLLLLSPSDLLQQIWQQASPCSVARTIAQAATSVTYVLQMLPSSCLMPCLTNRCDTALAHQANGIVGKMTACNLCPGCTSMPLGCHSMAIHRAGQVNVAPCCKDKWWQHKAKLMGGHLASWLQSQRSPAQ